MPKNERFKHITNPVQKALMQWMAKRMDEGSDLYDFANYIAALRKLADLYEKENSHIPEFKELIRDAMNNWGQ